MLKSRFFASLRMTGSTLLTAAPALAGHAGEMESPALMPHELLIGLVGLGGLVLLTLLTLAWVIRRVRGLDRRVRDLEGGRKT